MIKIMKRLIHNCLEEFMMTLSANTKFGDLIYIARISTFHFFLDARHNCSCYLGQIEDVQRFNKYEAFIEEQVDSNLDQNMVREIEAIPLFKIAQGRVIFIRTNDFHDIFYLIPLACKVRIIKQEEQLSYFYLKLLRRMFDLKGMLLMYSI
jgi:hypothetical protein